MRSSSFILLASVLALPMTATGQERGVEEQTTDAPEQAIKFLEISFSDPQGWGCTRLPDQDPRAAVEALNEVATEVAPTGGPEEGCLACTPSGAGSPDIIVLRAPDGADDMISPSAGVDICGDVLVMKSGEDSTTDSNVSTPSESGASAESSPASASAAAPPAAAPAPNPSVPDDSGQTATDGGERPSDSGTSATSA